MKGIRLLLAVLLAPLAFHAAVADDASDIARAATRQSATGGISTTRQKTTTSTQKTSAPSRAISSNKSASTSVRERATTTSPRDGTVATRTAKTPEKNLSARTATKIQPRTIKMVTRTAQPRATTTARAITKSRATTTLPRTRARTATNTATNTDVLNRDFSKCRTVFYDCMDEFCANKDSQLKRCACSSRIHEFDGTKKNLANVEEKLLDFSQRLLTVNMDKEDAMALYKPTEGELAYATEDASASKKMLDEIAKKLNTSFNDSNFDQGLNAISLSLNMDSAFDTVDSMAGASTTTKSGTDLYVSALPICREMALEVCSADDLSIAESSYQMAIEKDCNTVKKSYQTQVDQAREQVFESGALLDMSRLDIHQKRNSDDILTCKSKMLKMLTDSTVCGTDMGKCLDTTGRYIDPTTGSAFLTPELANLATLISRPDAGQTWRTAPGNDRFITFLNSKRKFLEPAMENCQNISDYVWDEFIDDALAQIKLAQDAKLEEMRQSCTTLTTQCLDDTYDSITEFDARALSIFGVAADKTVNAMCADVQNACTALMQTSGGAENWQSGMIEIATDKTYETIMQTCREVGRACITQACSSTSGNFGLCENIDTSINRKSIINRTACWDEVVACVASAGAHSLANIQAQHPLDTITKPDENGTTTYTTDDTSPESRPNTFRTFYGKMYGINNWNDITLAPGKTTTNTCIGDANSNCVHDICTTKCENASADSTVSDECYTCRLAERIWGNCEAPANTELTNNENPEGSLLYHNKIKTTNSSGEPIDTLLAWFAKNTGTDQERDSCRDTSCRPGYVFADDGTCVSPTNLSSAGEICLPDEKFTVYENFTNCCTGNIYAYANHCCPYGKTTVDTTNNDIYFGENNFIVNSDDTNTKNDNMICNIAGGATANLVASYEYNGKTYNIVCLGDNIYWNGTTDKDAYPNGTTVRCNGNLVRIDSNGHYDMPENSDIKPYSYYNTRSGPCVYDGSENKWKPCPNNDTQCDEQEPTNWSISYGDVCSSTRG